MVKCVIDEKIANEISEIPLSNGTVTGRIMDLYGNVKGQLIQRILSGEFVLQIDKTTVEVRLAILLDSVRYQYELSLTEDLVLMKILFC